MLLLLNQHDRENNRALRRERVFRARGNPFEHLSDVSMYENYRFTRLGCMNIINMLEAYLEHPTQRSHALPASLQVFVALRFYASGLLRDAKDAFIHPVSKATSSRVVRRVTLVLCHLKNQKIRFPTTPAAVQQTQRDFFAVAGFPRVIGAIDGTLVGIHGCNYGPDEYIYVSRKGGHAINVQLICNAHYIITNVVARWPGSTHDSRILRNSLIGRHFENGHLAGVLLGDSGYTVQPWLMTPVPNPDTAPLRDYNR